MLSRDKLSVILSQPDATDQMAADPLKRAALLDAMLRHIGDVDADLRDKGIYLTLARWVTEAMLSREEIHGLLPKLIDDEHLFFNWVKGKVIRYSPVHFPCSGSRYYYIPIKQISSLQQRNWHA